MEWRLMIMGYKCKRQARVWEVRDVGGFAHSATDFVMEDGSAKIGSIMRYL